MSLPPGFLDELRTRLSIGQVVGRKVMWDQRKSNQGKGDLWAPCPFHQEKSASFHVDDRKGYYYCFGCHAKGDAISFVRETENVGFMEAVQILAGEAGMTMPARDPEAQKKADRRTLLAEVMEQAVQFYRLQLKTGAGAEAREYLAGRGLKDAALERWEIGLAPPGWQNLWDHLTGKGVAEDLIIGAGLAKPSNQGKKPYDTFRHRIMFPIRDARGRAIAFGGRAMDPDDNAKYLNSPETELFDKGRNLFNLGPAREAAGKGQPLIVAEGYMDVIALAVAGFENAVAPLGTALTENQLELTWRVGGEPVLCFDGDGAGLRAANRSIDTALTGLKPGRSLQFALLPEGEDPDDLIKRAGASAFGEVLEGARPLAAMLWHRETGGQTFDTPERRAQLERSLFGIVSSIADENVKRHYQQDVKDRLAGFFGTSDRQPSRGGDGWKGRGDQGGGGYGRQSGAGQARQSRLALSESLMNSSLVRRGSTRPSLREATLVVTVINHPLVGAAHFDAFAELDLLHPAARRLHAGCLDVLAEFGAETTEDGIAPGMEAMQSRLQERGLGKDMQELDEHVRHNRVWQALPQAAFEDAADGWLQSLALYQRSRTLNTELKLAETAFAELGDEASYRRLVSVQSEIANSDGTEALIEGFGVVSGRPARNF